MTCFGGVWFGATVLSPERQGATVAGKLEPANETAQKLRHGTISFGK